jgi:response regulator RpfG family c-di-GMP phosphodiesterase
MPSDEDSHTSAMVDAVRDMAHRLEEYQHHADDERTKLLESVNGTVEAMRKDVYRAIISLQLNAAQHRDEHTADRKERASDAIDRLNRQLTINMWMGALTALVVINLLLIGFVVIRVAQVMYGR